MAQNDKKSLKTRKTGLSDIFSVSKKAVTDLFGGKQLVGLVETVWIIGQKDAVKSKALFDTGATRSSVDMRLAAKAGLGPIIKTVQVKSKTMLTKSIRRPVVKGIIKFKGRKHKVQMTVADRTGMSYPILIGRDMIHSNFILDVEKTHRSHDALDVKTKEEREEYFEDEEV